MAVPARCSLWKGARPGSERQHGVPIYYRPSNQETAEYLERCLGRTSEYAHSQTVREGAKTSQGLSEQGVPLLTAGEIKMMRDEDIIGLHRRLPPFQGKRMDWRRFQTLRQRHNLPTPTLPILPMLEINMPQTGQSRAPLYIDRYGALARVGNPAFRRPKLAAPKGDYI